MGANNTNTASAAAETEDMSFWADLWAELVRAYSFPSLEEVEKLAQNLRGRDAGFQVGPKVFNQSALEDLADALEHSYEQRLVTVASRYGNTAALAIAAAAGLVLLLASNPVTLSIAAGVAIGAMAGLFVSYIATSLYEWYKECRMDMLDPQRAIQPADDALIYQDAHTYRMARTTGLLIPAGNQSAAASSTATPAVTDDGHGGVSRRAMVTHARTASNELVEKHNPNATPTDKMARAATARPSPTASSRVPSPRGQ